MKGCYIIAVVVYTKTSLLDSVSLSSNVGSLRANIDMSPKNEANPTLQHSSLPDVGSPQATIEVSPKHKAYPTLDHSQLMDPLSPLPDMKNLQENFAEPSKEISNI